MKNDDDTNVDAILLGRLCKIYKEHPDYNGKQMRDFFFSLYKDEYTIEEYERADNYIIDAYSKD